jgi:Iap family predicted aminopeptidase
MSEQKIEIRVTETDRTMEVVVFSKRADKIEVVLGEGVHSVKCELTPTPSGAAYVGSAMGREIVYERSREQVQADVELEHHDYRDSRRR